ncbi:MAG: hypothetical protein OEU51_00980 [Gammaproteobacteria bacterium]|jgi:hypothetical protein|nr:hypothetical protein [Gammaproteobacteria bacterium]
MSAIETYLKSCRELSRFCSQNGWIDNNSLHYAVTWENDNEVLVDIEFSELLMEGGGSLAGKVSCFGRMRLFLDKYGQVIRCEIL